MSAWAALIAGILALDTYLVRTGRPSLSATYETSSRRHPVIVSAGAAYVLAHLHGVLPAQGDVLRGIGGVLAWGS